MKPLSTIRLTHSTIITPKQQILQKLYWSFYMDSIVMEATQAILQSTLQTPLKTLTSILLILLTLASQQAIVEGISDLFSILLNKASILLIYYFKNFQKNQKCF